MKPTEGRRRVVIEEIQPQVNGGRYPAKRILGDHVTVTAAIFSDGHDHVAARLLYRHTSQRKWKAVPFTELPNDLWTARFPVDTLGTWVFAVEGWVDHFDTWVADLGKRLAAQPDPEQPTERTEPQDIPLQLLIGAGLLEEAAGRAKGADAAQLKQAATDLRALAAEDRPHYTEPIADELIELAARYPDLNYATRYEAELPVWVDRERARFSAWYELFPRSCGASEDVHGTFRDVIPRLPEIAAMGFDILYMPPIHPIGVQFRKGRNNSVRAEPGEVGSPWAIGAPEGGHTAIHAQLGNLDDFDALSEAAKLQGLELALDIAFQCSPDHPWVHTNPDWFKMRPDGTIQYAENPPKKYQDIYPINFESKDWRGLWDALYNVFKFWIDRGVRVFRVDNPHTKALPFWEWCIAEILADTPEVIFLAEAFTRPHVMYSLAKGGYTQGYSYFTWRNTKADLEAYFEEVCNAPVADFYRPNVWPNTPDILHEQLQEPDPARRRSIFMQRAILAATLSANWGIYGPAYELCEWRATKPGAGKKGSEEYLDSEKYQIRSWDRSDPISIAPLITQLNAIRRSHPALQRNERLHFHSTGNDKVMCYSKTSEDGSDTILVAISLDTAAEQTASIKLAMDQLGLPYEAEFEVEDLLTGARFPWKEWIYVALRPELPAHIVRLLPTPAVAGLDPSVQEEEEDKARTAP